MRIAQQDTPPEEGSADPVTSSALACAETVVVRNGRTHDDGLARRIGDR